MKLPARPLRTVLVVLSGVVLFGLGWLTGRLGMGSTIDQGSLPEVERRFVERMRDASLVGSFTLDGQDSSPPRADRYDITSVDKVGDDLWRFNANIGCCGIAGSIPIVVPMRWVGDTPMIMMTNTALPGVGTFTVRVFFYEDRYAGFWKRGDTGGFMSGRVENQN
jgi:hypothetical protein